MSSLNQWVRIETETGTETEDITNAYINLEKYPLVVVKPNTTLGGYSIYANDLDTVEFQLHGNWTTDTEAAEALRTLVNGYDLQL